jgi:hypothetical protein
MRLSVNLIPALAYALVMMFSQMAGLTVEAEKSPVKQQIVSIPFTQQENSSQDSCVMVAKNGQIILSNSLGQSNLVWRIPNHPDTHCVN